MNRPGSRAKAFLLFASLALNAALIIACGWLYLSAQSLYKDYRYYRALDTGTSQSSTTPVTAGKPGTGKVILFGDSRIAHWLPAPAFSEAQFINAGVSGETTTEMRRRFEQDVLRHSPDIVVIQSGVNDLTAAITRGIENPQQLVDNLHGNMQYFIETLKRNNIQTVVTSIFPHSGYSISKKLLWQNSLNEKIDHSNQVIESMVKESGAQWLDSASVLYDSTGTVDADLYRDTLHVNASAYTSLNKQLVKLLSDLLASRE